MKTGYIGLFEVLAQIKKTDYIKYSYPPCSPGTQMIRTTARAQTSSLYRQKKKLVQTSSLYRKPKNKNKKPWFLPSIVLAISYGDQSSAIFLHR